MRSLPLADPAPGRPRPNPWRHWLRWPGLLGFAAVLAGLQFAPARTLHLLWAVVIPLLPLTFLLSPSLWRAACPLATLDLLGAPAGEPPSLGRAAGDRVNALGILLLLGIIPARRVLLEYDGGAMIGVLLALGGLAWLMGRTRPAKAGFCNALCPVLPVERLYGHAPLLDLGDTRCHPCVRCTTVGCVDRAPEEALVLLGGGSREGVRWLRTPAGLFVAGFPGLIVAFGLLPDPGPVTPWRAYGQVLGGVTLSWATALLCVGALRPGVVRVIRVLSVVSAGLFYWFAGPHMAAALRGGPAAGVALRVGFLLVVAWWATPGLRRLSAAVPAGPGRSGVPKRGGSRSRPG
ncbi:MAG TPA: hypothetical protein PKA50_03310 [Gemmatimonadales bacterium]|nr:hypothetical protein [Gemmatimonadales bacterium]